MPKRLPQIFLIMLFTALCGLVLGDFLYSNQRFPPNTFIEDVDVSDLKVGQVIRILLDAKVDNVCQSKITLFSSEEGYEYLPSEIGAFIKPRATAYRAFKSTYRSNYLKSVFRRMIRRTGKLVIPVQLGIEEEVAVEKIRDISKSINVASKEAQCLLWQGNKFTLTDEQIGFGVDINETIVNLKDSFAKGERMAPLAINTFYPKVYKKDLIDNPPIHSISRYRTNYGWHDDENRIFNIKRMSDSLNNFIILSGEVFSFLDAAGDVGKGGGYKEALVIVAGDLVAQYGGGSCQVATTLYNCALLADLEIIKRRNHSYYFYIYPLGRDSAIYPGSLDLQFKNDTGYPIMIRTHATENDITIGLYGTPTGKTVKFEKAKIVAKKVGFFSYEVDGKAFGFDLPFTTTVNRSVYKDGELIRSDTIKSHYRSADEANIIGYEEKQD